MFGAASLSHENMTLVALGLPMAIGVRGSGRKVSVNEEVVFVFGMLSVQQWR